MSWGKMHSPFEPFWLFCLLFLNTSEILKIWLNLVLLWAGAVVSALPTSSLMVLPSFSIRYSEVGVRLKSSAGNDAKWAIEKPHNSCHFAHAVCWAAPALFLGTLLSPALPFAVLPPREGRCDVSHGSSWLLPGVRWWPESLHEAVTPLVQERGEGKSSLLEPELLVYSPWHTLQRGFFSS